MSQPLMSTAVQKKKLSPVSPSMAQASGYQASKGNASSYTPAKSNAASYEATTYNSDQRDVDQKSTVAGQMTGLLDSNSAYMKRAETKGLQQASKRGLLNSSFAVDAAHGAAIDAALPIAQQDAQTFNNQSLANQSYENDARKTNATFQNESSRFNAQNQQQTNLANQDAENSAGQFNATNDQNMTLANMDAENQANQFNATQQTNVSLANQDATNRANEFNTTTAFNTWSQESQQTHQRLMETLGTDNKERLIQVEMNYKRQIENEKNGSEAYRQAIDAMGQALGNSQLSATQQQRAVDEITSQLEAYLDFNSILLGIDSSVPNASEQTNEHRKAQETKVADQAKEIQELRKKLAIQQQKIRRDKDRGGHRSDSDNR